MKKVFLTLMVMAIAMVQLSCNSDEEQTKAREGEREARVIKDVHLRPVQGSYGNRVITLRCEDSLYLEYRGQELSTLHHCSSKYELVGGTSEEIAALSGCYEVDSLSGALLGTSLTARFLGDYVEDALLTLPGNRLASDFSLQITPCHATLRMVCFNTDQRKLVAKGIYQENPTDTAYAIGEWLGIIEHHDTVRVIDTLRLGGDTVVVRQVDTVFTNGDTVVDSTFTLISHDGEETTGIMIGNILTFTCHNSVSVVTYRNSSPYSQNRSNFDGKFPYNYTESGTYRSSHVGQAHRVVNGNVTWGGFTQSFVHQNHYTVPTGYEAWLRYLDCDFVLDSVYGQTTGILVVGHFECGDHHTRATYFMPKNPTGDNPPTITRIDTLWLNCTTASASYIALTDQVNVAKSRTYRKINVWSDGHRDTSSAVYTATFNHLYNVVRVGQPTTSMATSVLVNVNSNTASFGGGAFAETLSSANGDRFCSDDWVSARLTTSGTEWNGNYGTSTYSVTVPETFLPPTGKRVIEAWASYAYQTNTSSPEEWYVLYTEDLANGQRYFEYIPHTTGYITYSASIVSNTIAISSSDTTAIRGQINAGRYGARVYNHNSTTHQWFPGMTHATQNSSTSTSSSWTVTFWLVNGTEANHVDLVVGTTDVNSADSRRGIGNGTYVEADGGRLYY